MKKIIALALAAMLLLALFAGCGASGEGEATTPVATTPVAEETTPAPAPEPGGATYGPATKKFVELISGGTYRMATATETEGVGKVEATTYAKDGMTATVSEVAGMKTRMVIRNGKIYTIMESSKTIMEQAYDASAQAGSATSAEGLSYTGDGKAEFAGKELSYEAYSIAAGGKLLYFIDGDNLAGIRTEGADGTKADLQVTALDQEIPDGIFEIPTDYTKA
jgi:hypothetical protein